MLRRAALLVVVLVLAAAPARADERSLRKAFDGIAASTTMSATERAECAHQLVDRSALEDVVRMIAADRAEEPGPGVQLAVDTVGRLKGYAPRREVRNALERGEVGQALLATLELLWSPDTTEPALLDILQGKPRRDTNLIILSIGRRGTKKSVPTLTRIIFEDDVDSQRPFHASVALRWIAERAEDPDRALAPFVERFGGYQRFTKIDVVERTRLRDLLAVAGATRGGAEGALIALVAAVEKAEPEQKDTLGQAYAALAAISTPSALDYLISRFGEPSVAGAKNEHARQLVLAQAFANARNESWPKLIPALVNVAEGKGRAADVKAEIYKSLEAMTGQKKNGAGEWLDFARQIAPAPQPESPDR